MVERQKIKRARKIWETLGVAVPDSGTARAAQYDLCVNYLVLDSWEHRDMAKKQSPEDRFSNGFRGFITPMTAII